MERNEFLTAYASGLDELVKISGDAGRRKDYVQGGGGNTSAKLDSRWMAVKASGYRLDQVAVDDAYAVIDYQALRTFFRENADLPSTEIEEKGSNAVKEATLAVEGMTSRRPSVEAGFHAILDACVLHTHSVYANLVCCSDQPYELAAEAMKPLGLPWGFVPYIDPGTRLSFAIAAESARVEAQTGERPAVIFMQNHGLIACASDAKTCLDIHERVNVRLAEMFGVQPGEWPKPTIVPVSGGSGFKSSTPWLRTRLAGWSRPAVVLGTEALYPDQLVFLSGKVAIVNSDDDNVSNTNAVQSTCTIDSYTGDVAYSCGENEALTIEETLCAVLFIHEVLERNHRSVQPMDASAKAFIAGWESESYRKKVTAGGGDSK